MEITNLRDLFLEISNKYNKAKNEDFTNHPIANIIREKSKEIIKPIVGNDNIILKGSAGQANWVQSPWMGIFNRNESDGAKEGIYIVYIFSEDMKRVYLTFNQGITNPIEAYGRKKAFEMFKIKILNARSNYNPPQGFNNDNLIKLSKNKPGSDYEKSTIFYKEYLTETLPSNESLEYDLKELSVFYDKYLLRENVLTEDTDFSEYSGGVEEGKRKLVSHYVKERNKKLIKEAKRYYLSINNELRCEICDFSFGEHYGERGTNYIEAHHNKKPVSQMNEGDTTSVKDIKLVCSNCHRMIHRKMPWYSIEELRKIYH